MQMGYPGTPSKSRMSRLEKLCHQIDDEKCTGGHFAKVFKTKLASNALFTPEDLTEFDVDSWGELFKLIPAEVMILKKYILSDQQ